MAKKTLDVKFVHRGSAKFVLPESPPAGVLGISQKGLFGIQCFSKPPWEKNTFTLGHYIKEVATNMYIATLRIWGV